MFFSRTSRVTFCELLTVISSPVFRRKARPPSTDKKRVVPPDLADLDRHDTAGRDDDAFCQHGVRTNGCDQEIFFADGSTIGPPADME